MSQFAVFIFEVGEIKSDNLRVAITSFLSTFCNLKHKLFAQKNGYHYHNLIIILNLIL